MQIVIKLSDETYKEIKEENGIYGTDYGLSPRITGKVVGAIQSGTPLPKGHGRLIDASELLTITDIRANGSEFTYVSYSEIDNAQTIIEADKGGNNEITD